MHGQDYTDIPEVMVHVFHQKLALFKSTLKGMFQNAGRHQYMIHLLKFQNCSFPHAHILIKFMATCSSLNKIDPVLSPKIPDLAADADLVRQFMLHRHPPDTDEMSKYCWQLDQNGDHYCYFGYPHPLQPVTTIDTEGRVHYRRWKLGDEWVMLDYGLPVPTHITSWEVEHELTRWDMHYDQLVVLVAQGKQVLDDEQCTISLIVWKSNISYYCSLMVRLDEVRHISYELSVTNYNCNLKLSFLPQHLHLWHSNTLEAELLILLLRYIFLMFSSKVLHIIYFRFLSMMAMKCFLHQAQPCTYNSCYQRICLGQSYNGQQSNTWLH